MPRLFGTLRLTLPRRPPERIRTFIQYGEAQATSAGDGNAQPTAVEARSESPGSKGPMTPAGGGFHRDSASRRRLVEMGDSTRPSSKLTGDAETHQKQRPQNDDRRSYQSKR
ncbi:hypothetical protein O9K51_07586 [Purpureocillium lavendulum]|uniref:Uncharacterized protein n=1 Tax=Purpureocillium lavendulum TaxID=1247861 RepID=A0AB34FNB7_9HYPO|nr:hypothetical protein O9K51_07586 [Purpureocillium lavendulum]